MNMLATGQPSQEITRSRRIGFLIYPDCEICDVCGPFDAFHWADDWLPRFGRTDEPGYQLIILAATPGPVRTLGGIEIVATHSFCDIGHGLDTLLVAGGCLSVDQACKEIRPSWNGCVRWAACAARGVDLYRCIDFSGGGPLGSPASDDALGVFRHACVGISVN